MHYGVGDNGWIDRTAREVKSVGAFLVIFVKLETPSLPPQTKLNFEQNGKKRVLFWPKHCRGVEGGGGRRDETKADQKIVIRSRALCNNYLEWLFHTSGLATSRQRERRSRETSESETGPEKVPSSFVLHCRFDYQTLFRKVSPRFAGRNKVQSRESGGNRA